jgi:hypothetical protein
MWTASTEAHLHFRMIVSGAKPTYGGKGGEYRSRTDDLLHAMQAL